MRFTFRLLTFLLLGPSLLGGTSSLDVQKETLENEVLEIHAVRLGDETPGSHSFSAAVTNRSELPHTFGIDIRTECVGLGWPNWQRQFFFPLKPHESRTVEAEYEISGPLLLRTLLHFGESPEYESWERLSEDERQKVGRPQIKIYWRREIPATTATASATGTLRDSVAPYSLYLSPIFQERLAETKQALPISNIARAAW
jgi:hypothetical protein